MLKRLPIGQMVVLLLFVFVGSMGIGIPYGGLRQQQQAQQRETMTSPSSPATITPVQSPTPSQTRTPMVTSPTPLHAPTPEPYLMTLLKTRYQVPILGVISVSQLATGFGIFMVGILISIFVPILLRQYQAKQADLAYQFNPYITEGAITTPSLFFGREEIRNTVLTTVHTQHIALYGAPQQGKSSLMLHLAYQLGRQIWADYHIVPVLLDMKAGEERSFFATLMKQCLEKLKHKHRSVPEQLHLHELSSPQQYAIQQFAEDMQQVREVLDTRPGRPLRLVLLIDDGDFLNSYAPTTLADFAAFFTDYGGEYARCILCRTQPDQRGWQEPSPPWQAMFTIEHKLGALTVDEAKHLITDPVPNYRYERESIEMIIEKSQRDPQQIQRICRGAVAAMLEQKRGRITREHVERAIVGLG